jgi:hypothetical protein
MPRRPSKKRQTLVTAEQIEPVIHLIRGQRIILDAGLARIYGATTKRLNEQVKRNCQRFPADFMFRLTSDDKKPGVEFHRRRFGNSLA